MGRPSLLRRKLEALRPYFARAAQKVVDAWEQDGEGMDEELGEGGVCDRVSEALAEVVGRTLPSLGMTDGGHDGDDHAYLIVYDPIEAFLIDIPPSVYETGGGYRWRKIEGAAIDPSDVVIEAIPRRYIQE